MKKAQSVDWALADPSWFSLSVGLKSSGDVGAGHDTGAEVIVHEIGDVDLVEDNVSFLESRHGVHIKASQLGKGTMAAD